MVRGVVRACALLTMTALAAGAGLLQADDGISLVIHPGPPGTATVSWTGSVPNFDLFRSPTPAMVTDPSHLILVTGARQAQDSVLPSAGSVLYYQVTSVGPCAPLNPAPICGSGERCYPTDDGLTSCAPPVGAGGQCSACTSDGQCSPVHSCIPDVVSRCMKWCRIGFISDCTFGSVCLPFAIAVYAGSQQYGACHCP
jgi:hypothetical protein